MNLRGYAPSAAAAAGRRAGRVPARRSACRPSGYRPTWTRPAALFRPLLADRRVLVVARQRPQRRAGPSAAARQPGQCLALVTSRDGLAGLVARDGARRITLDVLAEPDAVDLLRAGSSGRAGSPPSRTPRPSWPGCARTCRWRCGSPPPTCPKRDEPAPYSRPAVGRRPARPPPGRRATRGGGPGGVRPVVRRPAGAGPPAVPAARPGTRAGRRRAEAAAALADACRRTSRPAAGRARRRAPGRRAGARPVRVARPAPAVRGRAAAEERERPSERAAAPTGSSTWYLPASDAGRAGMLYPRR